MKWFNALGLLVVVLIMIPNVFSMIKSKETFVNSGKITKGLDILETIGRIGSMTFIIINIPNTYFGYFMDDGKNIYILVNSLLICTYYLFWIIYIKKISVSKYTYLSVIPTCIFLFSGIMIVSIPLILCSVLFMITHVTISIINSWELDSNSGKKKRLIRSIVISILIVICIIVASVFICQMIK